MAWTMYDSVAAYKQAGLKADYHWWPSDDFFAAMKDLEKDAKLHKGSTVRAYLGLTEDGKSTMWICVFNAAGHQVAGFDNSFPCPPRC